MLARCSCFSITWHSKRCCTCEAWNLTRLRWTVFLQLNMHVNCTTHSSPSLFIPSSPLKAWKGGMWIKCCTAKLRTNIDEEWNESQQIKLWALTTQRIWTQHPLSPKYYHSIRYMNDMCLMFKNVSLFSKFAHFKQWTFVALLNSCDVWTWECAQDSLSVVSAVWSSEVIWWVATKHS